MNKAIFLVLFVVSFSVLLGSNQDAYAVSKTFIFHTTIIADETIASGEIWTVNSGVILTINPGVTITVQSGGTISMPNGGTIDNRGTIHNSGIISINSINTFGTLFDSGTINNGGTINIDPSSTLSINGGALDNTGTINNSGSMANGGTLDNNSGGTINNGGHIVNAPGGTINNSGFIDNTGFITNGAGINNNFGGIINNNGGIANDFGGTIDNFGTINNNSGTIDNLCGGVYSGIPPIGNQVNSTCIDDDFDGIATELDTSPLVASDSFADDDPAPITSGTITSRGDQSIKIDEVADPDGVRILAETEGGPNPATIVACSGATTGSLTAEDEILVTCTSVDIQVVNGQIDITFTDGTTTGTSTLNAGDSIVFEPTSFSVTNNGSTPVIIIINGNPITIAPGETFSGGTTPQVIGGKIIPIESTSLLLVGAQSTTWMIPVVLSLVGIGLVLVRRK